MPLDKKSSHDDELGTTRPTLDRWMDGSTDRWAGWLVGWLRLLNLVAQVDQTTIQASNQPTKYTWKISLSAFAFLPALTDQPTNQEVQATDCVPGTRNREEKTHKSSIYPSSSQVTSTTTTSSPSSSISNHIHHLGKLGWQSQMPCLPSFFLAFRTCFSLQTM